MKKEAQGGQKLRDLQIRNPHRNFKRKRRRNHNKEPSHKYSSENCFGQHARRHDPDAVLAVTELTQRKHPDTPANTAENGTKRGAGQTAETSTPESEHRLQVWGHIAQVRLPADRGEDRVIYVLHQSFIGIYETLVLTTTLTINPNNNRTTTAKMDKDEKIAATNCTTKGTNETPPTPARSAEGPVEETHKSAHSQGATLLPRNLLQDLNSATPANKSLPGNQRLTDHLNPGVSLTLLCSPPTPRLPRSPAFSKNRDPS